MRVVRWLFEDRRTGRIVVGQKPNGLAWIVFAASVARVLRAEPAVARPVQAGSLALWALDEAARGVNPFRRLGGTLVLLVLARRALAPGATNGDRGRQTPRTSVRTISR